MEVLLFSSPKHSKYFRKCDKYGTHTYEKRDTFHVRIEYNILETLCTVYYDAKMRFPSLAHIPVNFHAYVNSHL